MFAARLNDMAFWLFIAILAWAPFPLGSNRQWSQALLMLLLAACWLTWWLSAWHQMPMLLRLGRRLAIPFLLALAALAWGLIQAWPHAPSAWLHPVWSLAEGALGHPLAGTISLNPWRTAYEVLKLASTMAAFWLALSFSLQPDRARHLLNALMIIAALYAVYALVLWANGMRQFEIFYNTAPVGSPLAGPFVLHNSYATYAGLGALAAIVRLFDTGSRMVRVGEGPRAFALSLLEFLFGKAVLPLLAFIVTFSTVAFSASRAGFVSLLGGLCVMAIFAIPVAGRLTSKTTAFAGALAVALVMAALVALSGDTLQAGLNELVQAGGQDDIREMAWSGAQRMIEGSPYLGLGLGSFENAFPLYSSSVIPYVLDKAHNDYLELAAGWGLPAAAAWWSALAWLFGLLVWGLFVRQRNRHYPLFAIGAMALVAIHSTFDFSLQIPAIAFTFAVILGLGVAQSFSARAMGAMH